MCAAFATLYSLSILFAERWDPGSRTTVYLGRGGLGVEWWPDVTIAWLGSGPLLKSSTYRLGSGILWWFETGFSTRHLFMPLWAPLLAFALPTAYAHHRCRRPRPGHCPTCGYDLTGNTTGVCPECGASGGCVMFYNKKT